MTGKEIDPRRADLDVMNRGADDWPQGLASVDIEPPRLWLRGERAHLQVSRKVAIVGSRAPTPYGEAQAHRFGQALARRGVCVVSGLARGVDAAAHAGALEAGGATIAVLGCGVDRPWPAGALADRMGTEGLLVSEFPPGASPRRHHFPLRNRIIAALSDGVLVIEAAHASGSLITARWAADQGQDVFALPGRVDHPMARGTLRLLREGATGVDSPEMLLEDLYGGLELPFPAGDQDPNGDPEGGPNDGAPTKGPSARQRTILKALRGETSGAADIADLTGLGVAETLAELTTLELDGWVRRHPGGLYAVQ